MFAVIKTGGKQYKVAEGEKITIEKLEGDPGTKVNFEEVLLVADEKNTNIGDPVVKGVTVQGKILEQFRGEKIIIFKKKRRHNYRRKNGHRQYLTKVEIKEIKIV
jgi:large subunit ribosomal protein L21